MVRAGKTILLILALMFVSVMSGSTDIVDAILTGKGPRTEYIVLYYYGSIESAYAALANRAIDMVGCAITEDLYNQAVEDPDIVVCLAEDGDVSYWAWSKQLLGIVNMEGVGPENAYTFMNAYKADEPLHIRLGLEYYTGFNIVYSDSYSDIKAFEKIYLYAGLERCPYNSSTYQPGFVQDWAVDTWNDKGDTKTRVTRWLRDGSHFVEPVTGEPKAQVNATHFLFSAWYEYAATLGQYCPTWADIHHIDVVDDFAVEIYFDALNSSFANVANGPLLPIDVWLQAPLTYRTTERFVEGFNLTTPGQASLSGKPVWFEAVTADGIPLTMFSDYNWVKGELEVFANLTDGTVVEVDYWYAGDAHGFTPGNLLDTIGLKILEGAGPWYVTHITPVSGDLTLKRNPYYWMETPPLGEVDFVWYSGVLDESRRIDVDRAPRHGCFRVDGLDLDLVEEALGSQGTGVPDANWFPGADLASEGGRIDASDASMVMHHWQEEWGATTYLGDIDGDRDVDIFDIVLIAGAYGTEMLDPGYNPDCDIDSDGDVDIFDVVIAAGNYGKNW